MGIRSRNAGSLRGKIICPSHESLSLRLETFTCIVSRSVGNSKNLNVSRENQRDAFSVLPWLGGRSEDHQAGLSTFLGGGVSRFSVVAR